MCITITAPAGCHNAKGMESEAQQRLEQAITLLFPQIGHCQLAVKLSREDGPRLFPRVSCEIDGMPPAFRQAELLGLLVGAVLYHLVVLADEYVDNFTTIRVEAQDGPYDQALALWRNPKSGETGKSDATPPAPGVFMNILNMALASAGADGPHADALAEQLSYFATAGSLLGEAHRGPGD
jgi:hypothetical protein